MNLAIAIALTSNHRAHGDVRAPREGRTKRGLSEEQAQLLREAKARPDWPGVAAMAKQLGVRKAKVCDAVRGVLTPGRYHWRELKGIREGTIEPGQLLPKK